MPIYEESLFAETSGAETHTDLYRTVPYCKIKFEYIKLYAKTADRARNMEHPPDVPCLSAKAPHS